MKKHTKFRTNVSIDGYLMEQAREYKIKLSPLLEDALREKLKKETALRWLEENREAIERYNKEVADLGVFSEGLRSF